VNLAIVVIVIQLIFLEGILSIDNAAVLGAMVVGLPKDDPIPWPKALTWLGHHLDRLLGHQRQGALRVGLLGAYLGRGLMLLAASFIIRNPWLRLIGALYLVRLAVEELGTREAESEGSEEAHEIKQKTFWLTVLNVELMDLAFSLDNVVAAVSLSREIWVVMLGVAIGILLMRFAAGAFSFIVEKMPVLKTAAYILVLNIGIELLLDEFHIVDFSDWGRFGISVATILLALAYSKFPFMRVLEPLLRGISRLLGYIDTLINLLLYPLKGIGWLIRKIFFRHPAMIEEESSSRNQ
jgi:tellurite resistance protein TerC